MRLQRGHGHTPVLAGVDAVACVRAAHRAGRLREPPAAGQGEPGGGVRQGDLLKHAFAGGSLHHHRPERRLAGHEGAAHVGKQGGGQIQPGHQTGVGEVGEVVAGLFGARTRRSHDGDHAECRVLFVQHLPAQMEFCERRRTERGEQQIGAGQGFVQRGLALVGLEVDAHGLDAIVQRGVGHGVVLTHGVATACALGSGRLGLEACRTHGLESHERGRSRQVEREAEHAHAAQGFEGGGRAVGGGHGRIGWVGSLHCTAASAA